MGCDSALRPASHPAMHPPMHLPRFSAPFRKFRQRREFSLFKMNVPTSGGERCPQTMSGRWTHTILDTLARETPGWRHQPQRGINFTLSLQSQPNALRPDNVHTGGTTGQQTAQQKLIDQPEQAGLGTFSRGDKRRQTKQENNRTPEERRSKTKIKTDQQNSNMATFPFQTVYNIPYSLEYRLPFSYYR